MKIQNCLLRLAIPIFLFSCGREKENNHAETEDLLSQRSYFLIQAIMRPLVVGQEVTFSFELMDSTKIMDSLVYLMDEKKFGIHLNPGLEKREVKWISTDNTVGKHTFKVTGFIKGIAKESATQSFYLKSDIVPESYSHQIFKTFPHDKQSFTQGLEWYKGKLYEGIGLNGKSAVLETDYITGKSVKKVELANEFFGEGITLHDNLLYQITWQNKKGFVYQLPDLKKVKEFSYSTDGWGLCFVNDELAMSDGTNNIYFLNPENFTQSHKIEVWDNKNPISAINEMEMVDGRIWANKYQTDTLLNIDPKTGKILGYADLSGILKDADKTGEEDVLNGIAYNPAEKLFYVTGKNWGKIFAIKLIKRKVI